jgi:hypothetical protein
MEILSVFKRIPNNQKVPEILPAPNFFLIPHYTAAGTVCAEAAGTAFSCLIPVSRRKVASL